MQIIWQEHLTVNALITSCILFRLTCRRRFLVSPRSPQVPRDDEVLVQNLKRQGGRSGKRPVLKGGRLGNKGGA